MENENLKPIEKLTPFTKMIMTIGTLPSSFYASMSYYESMVWLYEYLKNQVIPAVNNNGEAVEELQTTFITLKNWIEHYFDNLDLQEEVNTKLDEMAESGQLTDIIAQYLGLAGMIAFDTVADMKEAQNLVNGSKCRTLGYHSINDGGGAYYKIRQVTNDDNINEKTIIAVYDNLLVAELIIEDCIIPEQMGAYGDNTHDDTQVLQFALNFQGINHVVLSRNYKITSGLDVSDWKVVDGGGSIHSTSSCFEIDGHEHLTIRDLKLYPTTNAIHLFSNNFYSNYNVFENIFCYGTNAENSKGLFIQPTNRYMNEFTYRNCVFWNFAYGIYALNETDKEMNKHTFTECSTETSTVLGQYIKNGSYFTFNNCRHVEGISNLWKTEGTCNNLIINGITWLVNHMPEFSENTNGQILNGLRMNGVTETRAKRDANIRNGYVIPCKEAINHLSLNVNNDITITYGGEVPMSFKFGQANATNVTLTLPDTLYGNNGRIDEFYIKLSFTGGNSIIKVGETTIATLPAYSSGAKLYKAFCYTDSYVEKWFVTDLGNI